MKKYKIFLLTLLTLIACDATKRVPDGSYLLNKVKIDTDTKSVKASELEPFLRQKPNSSIFLIGKYRLHLYNIAPNDSIGSIDSFVNMVSDQFFIVIG